MIHLRNIPARAGKTAVRGAQFVVVWEHPRSRGENRDALAVEPQLMGTSPLARGKLGAFVNLPRGQRNIPARAGKTCRHPAHRPSPREHPRSRGENSVAALPRFSTMGTSPLARGKRRLGRRLSQIARNIPARAGKTERSLQGAPYEKEHPRSRGENNTGSM